MTLSSHPEAANGYPMMQKASKRPQVAHYKPNMAMWWSKVIIQKSQVAIQGFKVVIRRALVAIHRHPVVIHRPLLAIHKSK